MAEKKRRRQSQIFSEFKPPEPENLEENEALINHYRNKDYAAPLPKKYETLYEGARRGCSENGELRLGKSLDRRYIEDYQFWKQNDKERIKRRKLMIQKLSKGRRRLKPKQLTEKNERVLQKLIDAVPEFDEEESEELWSLTETGKYLESAIRLLPQLYGLNKPQSPTQSSSHSHLEGNTETPELDPVIEDERDDSPKALQIPDGLPPPAEQPSAVPLKRFQSAEEMEVLDQIGDEKMKKEFLDALFSEDLLFCGPSKGKQGKKKERMSVRQSVRRSARFTKDHDIDHTGSYFSVQEVSVSRSKAAQLQPLLDNNTHIGQVPTEKPRKAGRKRHHAAIIDDKENICEDSNKKINKKGRRRRAAFTYTEQLEDECIDADALNAGWILTPSASRENSGVFSTGPVFSSWQSPESRQQSLQPTTRLSSEPGSRRESLEVSSRRQSIEPDINLPHCVRRSLTGEFVPQRSFLLQDELKTDEMMNESNKSFNENSSANCAVSSKDADTQNCAGPYRNLVDSTTKKLSANNILGVELDNSSDIEVFRNNCDFDQTDRLIEGMMNNEPSIDRIPDKLRTNTLDDQTPVRELTNNVVDTDIPYTDQYLLNPSVDQRKPLEKAHQPDKENVKLMGDVSQKKAIDFEFSDSDEEEIISGILGKKTLGPRILKEKALHNQARFYSET